MISESLSFLRERQPHGVYAHGIVVQRVEVHLAVDACGRAGIQVKKQFLEVNILSAQEVGNGIVAAALHVQLHGGQQA